MIKALYGTHSGGARWHDRLFDILQELNFKPSKACTALDGSIPLIALTGIRPNISIILLFTLYEPVFYATHMTKISLLKVKRGLATGYLGSIVEMQ